MSVPLHFFWFPTYIDAVRWVDARQAKFVQERSTTFHISPSGRPYREINRQWLVSF